MIEILTQAVDAIKDFSNSALERVKDLCPDFLNHKIDITSYQVDPALHSACNFFGINDLPMIDGDSIGVYTMNPEIINDDVLVNCDEQFKRMGCDSFDDRVKVWSHEVGHVIGQRMYNHSWASEFFADCCVGVREEMLGLGSGKFEEYIGSTGPSGSHPSGELRLEAIKFGRQIVAEMKQDGIAPNWENCLQKFNESKFASINFDNYTLSFQGISADMASFYNGRADSAANMAKYYNERADSAQRMGQWYTSQGNHSEAKYKFNEAERYRKEAGYKFNEAAEYRKKASD